MSEQELNERQQAFVREYLIDLNGTQAAIRAGYSPKTAAVIAAENLTKPNIQEELAKAKAERSKRTGITADGVLKEYANLGFSKVTDFLTIQTERVLVGRTEEGEPISDIRQVVILKDTADIPKDKLAAIQSVEIDKDGQIKLKLHDKKGALDSIGKHLGMFIEKHEFTGKDGRPILVKHSGLASGMTKEELKSLLKERKDAGNG